MNNRRMVVCRICGRMVSRRFNNGMHRACLAADVRPRIPNLTPTPGRTHTGETSEDLPTLLDICAARIETREFVGASLFPAVEREFNKCTANVIAHSRFDAWHHIDTPADSPDHMRARTVWIEWFMVKSSPWRAGVCLVKRCNMHAVWGSPQTQLQQKRQ